MGGSKKTIKTTYYTILFVPSSDRWKLRWIYKALKTIGVDYGSANKPKSPWTSIYGKNKDELEQKADDLLKGRLNLPAKARLLSAEQRDSILAAAANLIDEGIDPVEAIANGADWLRAKTQDHEKPLADYWERFKESRTNENEWSPRVLRQWEIWYEENNGHLLQKKLVDFKSKKETARLISEDVDRWMNDPERNRTAKNTLKKYLSKLKNYLNHIALQTEHPVFNPATLKGLFSRDGRLSMLTLPSGLEEEQQNKKLTPEQAKHLIFNLIILYPEAATYYILRMFAGQRTLLLFEHDWSFVNWKDKKYSIPKSYTKNKKDAVEWGFDEINNFDRWILFASNLNSSPKSGKIVTQCQPTVTGLCAKIMNQHPDIYKFADGGEINGSKHMRNILRNTFISYSVEHHGTAVTARIVEDKYNLNNYLSTTQSGAGSNAREYFEISPDSLDLWNIMNVPPF